MLEPVKIFHEGTFLLRNYLGFTIGTFLSVDISKRLQWNGESCCEKYDINTWSHLHWLLHTITYSPYL